MLEGPGGRGGLWTDAGTLKGTIALYDVTMMHARAFVKVMLSLYVGCDARCAERIRHIDVLKAFSGLIMWVW
jgi:hypothetical protein